MKKFLLFENTNMVSVKMKENKDCLAMEFQVSEATLNWRQTERARVNPI